jgi:hypothetical protein
MPTNRTSIPRGWRPNGFSPEALRLFAELEKVPQHKRHSYEFKDPTLRLAELLGSDIETMWLMGVQVNDRERAPVRADGFYVDLWAKVRATREALLAAVRVH